MEADKAVIQETVPLLLPQVKRGRPKKPKVPKEKPEPKPRERKEVSIWRDDPRLYFRMYYHNRPKEKCSCPHCGNTFDSKRGLDNHVYKSVLCKRIREIKAQQADEQSGQVDKVD